MDRMFWLRFALVAFGWVFILLMPLMYYWPSGWRWEPSQYEYEQMIAGIYVTLGVFLILAARDPFENLSLIWFTIWSSFVHATIMLLQALADMREYPHMVGDIPALYLVGFVLAFLVPERVKR